MKKVLVLESKRDQAKTLIAYLKKYTNYKIFTEQGVDYNGSETFDLVIPAGATSTLLYVEKSGDINLGTITYTKANLITFDKIKTLKIVKEAGVPIPETFTQKNDIQKFPVFYKSLREEGYNERGIIQNQQELNKLTSTTIFYQEFINTQGTYAVGFIAENGEMSCTFIQDELVSYPKHGGSGVVLKSINEPRLIDYTNKIIKALNYSGWGLVEYKYCDIRKDYVFMEVNGKFWASIEFAFLNKPEFLEKLFEIKVPLRKTDIVIYMDRLIISDFSEIKKAFPYLLKSKWIKKQGLIASIRKRFSKNKDT